jgi:hypothetical protein
MNERIILSTVFAGLGFLAVLLATEARSRCRRLRGLRGEFVARWDKVGPSNNQAEARQQLDELLRERFGLDSGSLPGIDQLSDDALVAAVRTFSSSGQTDVRLSSDESRLLDAAEFVDAPGGYTGTVSEMILRTARLFSTGYSEEDVAAGFGTDLSAIRNRRRKRTLWAIEHSGAWVYPMLQFRASSFLEQLSGLDVVMPSLGEDLHPLAIAGFLETPQSDLWMDGRARTVLEWLSDGGGVDCVLSLIHAQELA